MKNLIIVACSIGLAVSVTTGCDSTGNGNSGVINVEDDNAAMIAAIEQARATFPKFRENWQSEWDGVSVKFGIPTTDNSLEHIWFEPVKIDGNSITARCANEPVNVPDLQLGDVRTLSVEDLSDWMIIDGSDCYGGYTIRVLSEMDPANAPAMNFKDL